MRSRKITSAYDSIQPSAAVYDALRTRIAEAQPTKKAKHPLRTGLLIAACLAFVCAASMGGYAAYQKWSLPVPETFPLTEQGVLDVHSTQDYARDELTTPAEVAPLTDEYFISEAIALLNTVGLTDVTTDQVTVSRQEDQFWSREEVEVSFTESEPRTTVTYEAERGILLSLTGVDWTEEGTRACETMEEAEALAKEYYALLPVQQGYELTGCTKYDEQYWSFEFCHEVMEGLYNYYEMVRLGLNPKTGRLCGCSVFNVPLLDDHAPEDVPLTQAQAEEIAQQCGHVNLAGCVLKSAELTVAMPNWFFTDKMAAPGGELRASKITRLAWTLLYERPDSEFADETRLYIDYYTGELLGGDTTG